LAGLTGARYSPKRLPGEPAAMERARALLDLRSTQVDAQLTSPRVDMNQVTVAQYSNWPARVCLGRDIADARAGTCYEWPI
jgi:hypothetical protein